jgi:hypothetical protein
MQQYIYNIYTDNCFESRRLIMLRGLPSWRRWLNTRVLKHGSLASYDYVESGLLPSNWFQRHRLRLAEHHLCHIPWCTYCMHMHRISFMYAPIMRWQDRWMNMFESGDLMNDMINFHWLSKCTTLFKSLQSNQLRFTHLTTHLATLSKLRPTQELYYNVQVVTQTSQQKCTHKISEQTHVPINY